ncbi:hypothetical protein [Mesorhizobium sp. 1B3]|uniref:hypothetical protein n=1 Tax=Mesorhizobium sp. 1B3 TaxID=3243599 RepID=UPI003D969935
MIFKLVSFFSAVLLSSVSAKADSIPRYDPPAYCKKVSDVSGGAAVIYNGCLEMEQEAYDHLKVVWSGISSNTQNYCDEVARVSDGSYTILKGCIEMEADAAASTPEFKF